MEIRPFGKTGQSFPILGFGCGNIGDNKRCSEKEAVRILNLALDRGIRYFDTAVTYTNGQSEKRVGKVAKHRRDEMWIATKVWETGSQSARRQLEESLKRLQTDHIDEWRLHDLASYERMDAFTRKGGGLEAAIKAKEEGLVGHISISSHGDPQIMLEALNRYPFESALVALSVLDHFYLSFAEEFVPVANERGVAVIAMKTLAMGKLAHELERSLRYAFSLPVAVVIVGIESQAQLEENLKIADTFTPMTDAERVAFFKDILPLVNPDMMRWKSINWSKPTDWLKREPASGKPQQGS